MSALYNGAFISYQILYMKVPLFKYNLKSAKNSHINPSNLLDV